MNNQKSLKIIIILSIIFSITLLSINYFYPPLKNVFARDKEEDLEIIAVSPRGGTEGVRGSDSITVTFSHPVVALAKLGKPIKEGPIKLSYKTAGTYKWLGTWTLAFYPEKPFPKNTGISAKVEKGIKSVTGKKLKKDYKWDFETQRPGLSHSRPYNNKKWIELDALILLYYNMPMDKEKAKEYITLSQDGVKRKFDIRYIQTNELTRWEKRREFDLKTVLALMPENKFRRSSSIWVSLDKGMPAIEGDLGTKKPVNFKFSTYNDFKYTGKIFQEILPINYKWCQSLLLPFSNPVEYRELYKHMHFKPEIKLDHESVENRTWNTHEFCMDLNFKPETRYELVIDKDLQDIFNQKLGEDIKIKFDVGSYLPEFSIPTGMGIIESYEGRKIPVFTVNPENVKIHTRTLKKDEIIPFLLWKRYFSIPYKLKHTYKHIDKFSKDYDYDKIEAWEPKLERNQFQIAPLSLSPYMKNKDYGFLHLYMEGPVRHWTGKESAFLQITGLGITGKFSAETNLIFVTDLKEGNPVEKADIEIRDDFNKVLWKGKTDKYGLIKTPGWLNLKLTKYTYNSVRQWAFASKNKDMVFINNEWGTGINPWQLGVRSSFHPDFPYFKGDIRTERGIYRPGEKVHLKGVLREKTQGDWKISSVKELKYEIKDSRYNKIKEGAVKLNEFGTFSIDYKLPEDAPTGYYSINLFQEEKKDKKDKIKPYKERKLKPREGRPGIYGGFRVEVFQPVQFEVKVWCEDKEYFLKDTANFKITGWYLFGAPMSEKKVVYTASAKETFYSPPNNPGFRFSKMQWLDDTYYYPKSKTLESGTKKLDKKGELNLPIALTIGEDVHAMNVSIEATVYGEDQQRVSGRKSLLVHGSDFYIGVKRQKYFVEKGKEAVFEIISVDPDGERRNGDKINVKAY